MKKLYSDVDKKQIGNFFGDLFDFKFLVHGQKANSEELLYKVAAKHLVIMFRAFNEFQSFDQATKDSVINKFLDEKVLKDQIWSQLKIKVGKKELNLDLSHLNEGIKKYANMNNFTMKPISELKQEQSPKRQKRQRI